MTNYSLHTIRGRTDFVRSFLFRHCLRIVCSGVQYRVTHGSSRHRCFTCEQSYYAYTKLVFKTYVAAISASCVKVSLGHKWFTNCYYSVVHSRWFERDLTVIRDFKLHLKFERIVSSSSIFYRAQRIFLFFVNVEPPWCVWRNQRLQSHVCNSNRSPTATSTTFESLVWTKLMIQKQWTLIGLFLLWLNNGELWLVNSNKVNHEWLTNG